MSDKERDDEGLLSRWSKRKLAARTGHAETTDEPDASEAGKPAEPHEEVADAPEREWTEADIEALGPDADYSVFLKKGVSTQIQRLALRKLWTSDPVLANLDGLVDYGEDFAAAAASTAGDIATAWKAGRGYLDKEAGAEAEAGERVAADVEDGATEAEEKAAAKKDQDTPDGGGEGGADGTA